MKWCEKKVERFKEGEDSCMCQTCSVRLLLSSVWIQARSVSSVMKIWAALANRTGASALIICIEEMELHLVKYTHRLLNFNHMNHSGPESQKAMPHSQVLQKDVFKMLMHQP